MVRLWSFWAIVASARAGSRKNSESGILALHGRADPAEVLHDELREEVAQLGSLRLVRRRVVLHRLGPARRRRCG